MRTEVIELRRQKTRKAKPFGESRISPALHRTASAATCEPFRRLLAPHAARNWLSRLRKYRFPERLEAVFESGLPLAFGRGWIAGTASISLHRLALIAYCCNCAIADVLLGNKVRLSLRIRPSHEPQRLLIRRSTVGRKTDAEMKEAMQQALRNGRALSAYQMADDLRTSTKYLRMNFPEDYGAIVAAGRKGREREVLERTRRFTEEYCRAHRVIANTGEYPSRRRVIANMGQRSCKRGSWRDFRAAQREAHARYGTAPRGNTEAKEIRPQLKDGGRFIQIWILCSLWATYRCRLRHL